MKVIIDRFEKNIAVVELNGEMLHAPRALFAHAKEGDVVELTVLPRRSPAQGDDASETEKNVEKLRRATDNFFRSGETELPREEEPAALFARLRRKSKHGK